MKFRTQKTNPFTDHLWYAWHPVQVFHVETTEDQQKVLVITWVWLEKVIRRLDKNLSGTFKWTYFTL